MVLHGEKLTRAMLVENSSILAQTSVRKGLQFSEAIFIIGNKPSFNVVTSSFDILPPKRLKRNQEVERQDDARPGAVFPCSPLARLPSGSLTQSNTSLLFALVCRQISTEDYPRASKLCALSESYLRPIIL
jgi:hypothetical protein